MPIQRYTFEIFADYFQVWFEDESASLDPSEAWTEAALERLLAFAANSQEGFAIATARNMTVPIQVEIHDEAPQPEGLSAWDRANECSVALPSGVLVIMGATDYRPDAARISLPPGTYRVRIFYGNLADLSADHMDGNDRYLLQFWRAPFAEPLFLK